MLTGMEKSLQEKKFSQSTEGKDRENCPRKQIQSLHFALLQKLKLVK